jgi:antiviral helicase SLH1
MGTQYVYVEDEGLDRQLRDYELIELVRMQSRAVRHSGSGHFHLFCQAEAKDTFTKFLNDGLPLESQLLETHDLKKWYYQQIQDGTIVGKQQAVDILSFTFLARRVVSNPTYYDVMAGSRDQNLLQIVDKLGERLG